MSRLSERPAIVGLVLSAALAGPVAAQPTESPSAASIKTLQSRDAKEAGSRDLKDAAAAGKAGAAAPKDASVSTSVPRAKRPVLRCWQEGRLVFEGAGVLPPNQGAAAIELRSASGTTLQVFDLKNGLCMLDHGNSE